MHLDLCSHSLEKASHLRILRRTLYFSPTPLHILTPSVVLTPYSYSALN